MGKKKYHFNKAQIAEMEKGYNPLIVLEYLRKVQPDILRTHTGEKPFACKHLDCTYRTAQTSNLTRHMCTHTGELFACTHIGCTYRTAQTGHLTEHRRTHTGELFACKQCGYRTAYKSVLKTHMRTHTGEKPFACKHLDCTYRTTQTSNLTRHMRTHR